MSDRIQYKLGQAMRVFDVFGSVGFNVSENGQLGYFGPGGPWYAADGQWITRHPDGTLSVSGDGPELLLMAIEPVTARQVQVAYQAFLNFARELHLTWHQKSLLLSVSERTLRRWATDTPHPNWDQKQRLGWILTIYYFAGKFIPGDASGWLMRPNSHPALKGKSPLAHMIAGDIAGVLQIARSLEPWV